MGRGASWALGPLMNSSLWGTGWSQRPRWYYGGLEPPFEKTLDPPQVPWDLPFNTQALLWYGYWLLLAAVAIITVSSVILFMKKFIEAQRQKQGHREPPQQGDSEEAALMEALHLMDAIMEKTQRHLRHLERRRGGCQEAKPCA